MSSGPPPPGYPGAAPVDQRRPTLAAPTYPAPQQPFSVPMPGSVGIPLMQQQSAYPILPPPAPPGMPPALLASLLAMTAAGGQPGMLPPLPPMPMLPGVAPLLPGSASPVTVADSATVPVPVAVAVPGTPPQSPVAQPWPRSRIRDQTRNRSLPRQTPSSPKSYARNRRISTSGAQHAQPVRNSRPSGPNPLPSGPFSYYTSAERLPAGCLVDYLRQQSPVLEPYTPIDATVLERGTRQLAEAGAYRPPPRNGATGRDRALESALDSLLAVVGAISASSSRPAERAAALEAMGIDDEGWRRAHVSELVGRVRASASRGA
ncbi:hypothetical protein GGF31_008829 [Allomyces arbusculus]|nr:hypothetical protein GGF31_008829 [Allomyces arbusculus]